MKFGFIAKHREIPAGGVVMAGAGRLARRVLCLAEVTAQSTQPR